MLALVFVCLALSAAALNPKPETRSGIQLHAQNRAPWSIRTAKTTLLKYEVVLAPQTVVLMYGP